MRSFIVGVVFVVLAMSTSALAICRMAPDPTVFCSAGQTAVVAVVVDGDTVVEAVGGEPMPGIIVGATLDLRAADDVRYVSPGGGNERATFFVLRNVGTWTRALPVVDDRVVIDDFGEHSVSIDEAFALITLDPQACFDQSNAQVSPPIYTDPCNDEIGCAATPASPFVAVVAIVLGRTRRRRR